MLTAEQIAIRSTGIGASEVAEVVGLSPFRGPIDVWLDKTGRAKKRRETTQTGIGHALESFALAMYSKRSGVRLSRPRKTFRHPTYPHMLASPDGLGRTEDSGAEAKIVGWRMAHHWADDTMPDYVRLQCLQNMAVTGRSRWAIVALIGGTDLRSYTIERDREIESLLGDRIESFWTDFVASDRPPPIQNQEERRRYLRTRYPGSEANKTRRVSDPVIDQAVARIREIDVEQKRLKIEREELVDVLCDAIGDDYGIDGDFGKAIWYPTRSVEWKSIAEDLAGGAVPADVIERHRGELSRTFRLIDPKEKKRTR